MSVYPNVVLFWPRTLCLRYILPMYHLLCVCFRCAFRLFTVGRVKKAPISRLYLEHFRNTLSISSDSSLYTSHGILYWAHYISYCNILYPHDISRFIAPISSFCIKVMPISTSVSRLLTDKLCYRVTIYKTPL